MVGINKMISTLTILACFACSPLKVVSPKNKNINIRSECKNDGKILIVKIYVDKDESALPWEIEFPFNSVENIKIENSPFFTAFSWTVPQEKVKASTLKNFKIHLTNKTQTYSARVEVQSTSSQIVSSIVQSIFFIR